MRIRHLFTPYTPSELTREQLQKAEIALLEVLHKSEYYRHMAQMLELRVQRLRRVTSGSFDRPHIVGKTSAMQVDNERID
jgi:hypothetical protein